MDSFIYLFTIYEEKYKKLNFMSWNFKCENFLEIKYFGPWNILALLNQ